MKIETTLLAAAFAVSLGFGGCAGGEVNRKMKDYHEMIMKRFDLDHDAKLSVAERVALTYEVESGRFQPPGAPPGGGPGGPPPGGKPPQEILDKYDTNKNGQIDGAEEAAIRADIASGKLKPPGGGAPPPPPR